MDADRPIATRAHDRLGFAPVAEQLARTIGDQSAADGLVFGIEGKWGSGKSTLINLTIEALHRLPNPPETIAFSPWLVGDRDTLLQNLFNELAAAAANIEPTDRAIDETPGSLSRWQKVKKYVSRDAHWRLRQKELLKKRLGAQLNAFGTMAGAVGKFAKAAGALGIPGADVLGRTLESGSDAAKFGSASVAKTKSQLVGALRFLSRRIVVFVDDLDRLEPREASEVLRLIRAVADFPNVIYVLSYDPDVVASVLQKAVQVDDGAAFLEKIVQINFRVPRPEAFDLRAWFRTEVTALFANNLDLPARNRLIQVIDIHGGRYLQTPRDVVRAINALRLHGIPVRDHIDIPDMVWLQLVRIGKPDLYSWVEEYLTELAAVANGAIVSDEAAQAAGVRLNALLTEEGVDLARVIIDLSLILPGVGDHGFGADRRVVFNQLARHVFDPFIAARPWAAHSTTATTSHSLNPLARLPMLKFKPSFRPLKTHLAMRSPSSPPLRSRLVRRAAPWPRS